MRNRERHKSRQSKIYRSISEIMKDYSPTRYDKELNTIKKHDDHEARLTKEVLEQFRKQLAK